MPYSAVLLIAALGVYIGYETNLLKGTTNPPKVAFAEKSAVVIKALLTRNDLDKNAVDAQIKQPILAVIKRYVEQGYVVIDSGRDENGMMAVSGIPKGAIDITPELYAALKLQTQPNGNPATAAPVAQKSKP